MSSSVPTSRPLGTMVAYGFARGSIEVDLAIADKLGATLLEILPDWANLPDPIELRRIVSDRGFRIHSAHGCWGGQTIRAARVDLGSADPDTQRASLDDLRRCLDWLRDAGGTHLVVHPGGYSDPSQWAERREALRCGLIALAEHIAGSDLILCVENMPHGVHPGSQMADLAAIVAELDCREVGLALDTGHAHISSSVSKETIDAGSWLKTTHVHDNNGRQDSHEPPGVGTIPWDSWPEALDKIGYEGPIMLECIRHLRQKPESLNEQLASLLAMLTVRER